MSASRKQRLAVRKHNAKQPARLTVVPRHEWPDDAAADRIAVYRSRDYLVQVFEADHDARRLSVNRTDLLPSGQWDDRLEWDELQAIKRQCGYGDRYAVEVFPRDRDIVNVANMRHLWVLPEPLPHGWFAG